MVKPNAANRLEGLDPESNMAKFLDEMIGNMGEIDGGEGRGRR